MIRSLSCLTSFFLRNSLKSALRRLVESLWFKNLLISIVLSAP